MEPAELIRHNLTASAELKSRVASDPSIVQAVGQTIEACLEAFRSGHKVMFCGNGGSAADAQHLAAELSGRFYYDRPPLASDALHCNTSYLTAVANDYGYHEVYARLVTGLCQKGDVLVGLSTSGNSINIVQAFRAARELGVTTVGMTGSTGELQNWSDIWIAIPSSDTPRIQECHMVLGHSMCQAIESALFPRS